MEGLARSVRLIIGLGMVAAGTMLAAPTGLVLADWARSQGGQSSPASPAARPGAEGPTSWEGLPGQAMPVAAVQPGPPAGWIPEARPAAGAAAAELRIDYQPPVPPAPLPPPAGGLAAAGPDLSVAYRSTLETPPPPLIDGQRPPPLAVGWTVRGSRDAGAGPAPSSPPTATYRVRDGDDLTAIATRFYGTPAAARLIWEANRGRLTDPALLPIGQELVLPPSAAAGTGQLEPAVGHHGVPSPPPAAGGPSWLGSPS